LNSHSVCRLKSWRTPAFCVTVQQSFVIILPEGVYNFPSINVFSIIVNILHLIGLKTLDKSKRTAYFWVLVNIRVLDIASSVAYSLAFSCIVLKLFLNSLYIQYRVFQIAATILAFTSQLIWNSCFALGSYGRYISLCQPFKVSSDKILNNFGLCISLIWITNIVTMSVTVAINTLPSCISDFGAIPTQTTVAAMVYFFLNTNVTFAICMVCLCKSWKELKRMQRSNTFGNSDDILVKRSSQYIMLICAMLYLSYVPTFLGIVFDMVSLAFTITWVAFFYQPVYGITNVIVYICMTPGYCIHAMNLLRWKKPTAVAPGNNMVDRCNN